MSFDIYDVTIKEILNNSLDSIEKELDGDVLFYYGEIRPHLVTIFRDIVEKIAPKSVDKRLIVILNTPGGQAETVEKMVDIIRHHYNEVFFVVPDYAMSAGTIFCMSGNKIYMDYSSSLGPIDPQVVKDGKLVPALGYLDKFDELIEKARKGELTQAEFLILQNQDLAELRSYEQAEVLSIHLLKNFLIKYKFSDWKVHNTPGAQKGKPVTATEKEIRADEIATELCDNNKWFSHGRFINVGILTNDLKLKIEDYSAEDKLRNLIRTYNDLIIQHIRRGNYAFFVHTKNFI